MVIKIKILDRYLYQQLIVFFIGSIILLTIFGVALGNISDLTYKISEYNLPLLVAMEVLCLKIPEYAAYALPIALLLTTLLVYGRLNNNLELIACYSSGISVYALVRPALLLSILITGTTFLLNEFVVSPANHQIAIREKQYIPEVNLNFNHQDLFYPEYQVIEGKAAKLLRLYYAQKFNQNKFQKIIILNWQKSLISKIIIAEEAIWHQKKQTWELINGRIETLNNDASLLNTKSLDFMQVDFFNRKNLSLPGTFFEIANQPKDPQLMSLSQSQKYLQLIINSNNETQIRLFQVRIQQKLAFPFICIVFTLLGSSIGVNLTRINRGKGFGLCVVIVFTYYLLGFMIGSLGIVGLVAPGIAGWLPNLLGWGVGVWLLLYGNNR